MYTSVFLLGPDQWDDEFEVEAPTWLLTELKDLGEQGYQPKHLRTYLKRIIERDPSRRAVVMDPSDQVPGETDGDFFNRLELENEVDSYVITVPSNTKILGTIFEGGMLERDFHYGTNPRILLFLQSTYAGRDHHDKVEFIEQGKRTRYLESLAAGPIMWAYGRNQKISWNLSSIGSRWSEPSSWSLFLKPEGATF